MGLTATVEGRVKMADKKKNSGESKTDEIKEKLIEGKENAKEKFEDCKEKASEKVDAVKEKASEVLKNVKGETEEETDCRMLVSFALLAAWGSGYLTADEAPAAVLLGGLSMFFAYAGVTNQSKKKK